MKIKQNGWPKQKFTPEKIQTFHDLYKAVRRDIDKKITPKSSVKENKLNLASQGLIFAVGIAILVSAVDQINPDILDNLLSRKEDIELKIDPNDPFLKTGQTLKFPKPGL